jgi:uncharacterized protein YpuA (DUF1002 family)
MSHQELSEALEVVHEQLAEADHLDPEDVEKLQATMREIQVALNERASEDSLSEQIASSARKFEESHPVLTKTLGRVADMLQQMGI